MGIRETNGGATRPEGGSFDFSYYRRRKVSDMNQSIYGVVRALALTVNALALWTDATFFARNWSNWHENQTFGYGLLLLASTLAIIALAWPAHLREPSRETVGSR